MSKRIGHERQLTEGRPDTYKKIGNMLPADLTTNIPAGLLEKKIAIPEFSFLPDEWSAAFLRGLQKADLNNQTVWEIGSGSGLNLIMLKQWYEDINLYHSDLDPRCTDLTRYNLEQAELANDITQVHGPRDLTEKDEQSWTKYWDKLDKI
jgi:methylase of polypeptide subunit release factors